MQTVGNLPIRHKTRATYLSMLRLHVFPTLAHRDISTIKRLDIQSTIHGLPPQTSAMSLAVIKTIFREALAQEIVDASPAHGVSGPKIMVKPREFLTWDEIFILLEVESLIRRGGGGGSGMKEYVDGNPWKQVNEKIGIEKTKSLIKVYCRVNNIDYEESRTPMEDIKVSINEFERFVKEAVSVKVNI